MSAKSTAKSPVECALPAEEWAHLVAQGRDEWAPLLLDAAEATDFTPLGDKNGVQIHCKVKENSPICVIRGRTLVRVDQDTLRATLISWTNERFNTVFSHIDPMFTEGKVLDYFPRDYAFPSINFSAIKWGRYTFPTGIISDRDVVFVEHVGEMERNGVKYGYGVAGSLHLPQWPEIPGCVRLEIFQTGYVFKMVDAADPDLVELTYLVQADPKGLIPAWAVNIGAKEQAQNVARMRDWLESIVAARHRLACDLTVASASPAADAVTAVLAPPSRWTHHDLKHVRDVHITRRGHGRHVVHTQPGAVVRFAFFTQHGDIGFTVDGGEESGWGRVQRYNAHDRAVHGHVVATCDRVEFVWHNDHSWFTAKVVYFSALSLHVAS